MSAALDRLGIADVDLSPAPELAEALVQCGRGDEAVAVSDGYRRRAAAKGQPWALARAARAEGLVADDDAFAAWFEQALRWHESTPDTFERARSELAYGERLRRVRRRGDAREHLRAAFAAFRQLGAEPWAERARLELAATGETARKRDPSTLDQLTPRELQIALDLAVRSDDARGRGQALPQPEDDRVPPAQRLPQARHRLARRAHRGLRPGRPELIAESAIRPQASCEEGAHRARTATLPQTHNE